MESETPVSLIANGPEVDDNPPCLTLLTGPPVGLETGPPVGLETDQVQWNTIPPANAFSVPTHIYELPPGMIDVMNSAATNAPVDIPAALPGMTETTADDARSLPGATEMKTDKVFSSVVATLSEALLNAAKKYETSLLQDILSFYSVELFYRTNGEYCISGSAEEILRLQRNLKQYLTGATNIDHTAGKEPPVPSPPQPKEAATDDKATSCDILQPTISMRGRQVKQPARFFHYLNYAGALADDHRSMHKRKPSHTRKYCKQISGTVNDKQRTTDVEAVAAEGADGDEAIVVDPSGESQEHLNSGADAGFGEYPDYVPQMPEGRKTIFRQSLRCPKKDYESLAPFKYFCSSCSFKSKRKSHFDRHLLLHKKNVVVHSCTECSFTSTRLSHLQRHKVIHCQSLLSCQICKYKTDNSRFLVRHIQIKHQLSKTKKTLVVHTCSVCNYETDRVHLFKRHLRQHPEISEKAKINASQKNVSFSCDLCAYVTKRKEHFLRHCNDVHNNVRPFLCDHCGSSFKRKDALAQHKTTHLDRSLREFRFHCQVCSKGFLSQTHLNEHMTIHTNNRAHLCHICGNAFKTRSVQQKHIYSIHLNPGSNMCNQCDKRFNTKYALNRHLRTHDTPGMRESQSAVQEAVQALQAVQSQAPVIDDAYVQAGEAIQHTYIAPTDSTDDNVGLVYFHDY